MQNKKKVKINIFCILLLIALFNFTNALCIPENTDINIEIKEIHLKESKKLVYAEEVYKVPESKSTTEVTDYTKVIDDIEGGSTFEKIIAKVFANCIGAIMGVISKAGDIKTLDGIIFNTGTYVDGFTPLAKSDWKNINDWYLMMIALSSAILFISILVISIKFIKASGNLKYREEAINSLKRLFASAFIIVMAPIIIHLLLYINNNFVNAFYSLISSSSTSLNSTLGGSSVLNSLEIESPLAGVLILGLFAYLQIKINILFIIRNFNIIVYTIFTPFAATLWIMDENVNGAKVWLGELLSNIFMQVSYAFLFALYLSFMSGKSWLVQLIWGNLILVTADVLRNMLQGKLTELSGVNEGRVAGNMLMGGAAGIAGISALAGTAKAFKAQIPNDGISTSIGGISQGNLASQAPAFKENPTFNEKSISRGNKIASVAGKLAKGAFTMGAAPIAMASGNSDAMKVVNKVGSNIESGVSKVGAPLGRVASAGITKMEETESVQNIKTKFNSAADKFPNKLKDAASIITGKSADDTFKFR